jgi:hypothetical protein
MNSCIWQHMHSISVLRVASRTKLHSQQYDIAACNTSLSQKSVFPSRVSANISLAGSDTSRTTACTRQSDTLSYSTTNYSTRRTRLSVRIRTITFHPSTPSRFRCRRTPSHHPALSARHTRTGPQLSTHAPRAAGNGGNTCYPLMRPQPIRRR